MEMSYVEEIQQKFADIAKTTKRTWRLKGGQTTAIHATGIMHLEEIASVGSVARGIHIRKERFPAPLWKIV